jgi:hypothetical protein
MVVGVYDSPSNFRARRDYGTAEFRAASNERLADFQSSSEIDATA